MAFEAVNRAYKMLENDTERKKCLEVVDEARVKVEEMVTIVLLSLLNTFSLQFQLFYADF